MKFTSKQHVYIEDRLLVKPSTIHIKYEELARALIELRQEEKIEHEQLEETLIMLRADPAGQVKWETFLKECCQSLVEVMRSFNLTTIITSILKFLEPKFKSKMQRVCRKFYEIYIPASFRMCPSWSNATRKMRAMIITEPTGATPKATVTWYRLGPMPFEDWV